MAAALPVARGLLRLLRPGNAAMAALGGATGFALAGGSGIPLLAVAAVPPLLVAAFGNVLNDVADAELDRSAHPQRPLPSGTVPARAAVVVAFLLLAVALPVAALGGWKAALLAGVNAGLLGLYEWRLKAQGLPGNATVALLVGSTFVYGGIVAAGGLPLAPMLWLLAGLATLSNLSRELLKDVEDRAADAGHRRTFPLRHGASKAALVAFLAINLAVLASVLAFLRAPAAWWPWWLALLALADLLLLTGGSLAWVNVATAQRTLKLGMLVALVAFLSGPLLGSPGLA